MIKSRVLFNIKIVCSVVIHILFISVTTKDHYTGQIFYLFVNDVLNKNRSRMNSETTQKKNDVDYVP